MRHAISTALLAVTLQNATAGVDPEVDLRKAELAVENARAALRQPDADDEARQELLGTLQRLGNQRSFVGDDSGAMAAFDEFELSRATDSARAKVSEGDLTRLAHAQQETPSAPSSAKPENTGW